MAKKIYIDNRVTTNGKKSQIDQDNSFDLNNHIKLIISENPSSGSIVTFDNTITGDLSATTVQDAIDEFSWLANEWTYTTVNISATELQTMGSAPIELLPAPGAGAYYDIRSITVIFTNTAAPVAYDFAATDILLVYSTNFKVQIDNSALITGLPVPNRVNYVTFTPSSPTLLESNGVSDIPVLEMDIYQNTALRLGNINGADASQGNGTMKVKIEYKINSI